MNDTLVRVKTWIEALRARPNHQTPPLLIVVMVISAGLVWVCTREPSKGVEAALDERATADTFVPLGYTLIPIEVENAQALDSILGSFGVVDLYTSPAPGITKPTKVASRIKIIRAPLNPSSFAVLVQDPSAGDVVQGGRYIVVIRNPKESGTRVESRQGQPRRSARIIVETIE